MKISYEDFENIPKEQRNKIYEIEDYGTFYYVNGKIHRQDRPSIEFVNGTKKWIVNGKYHRLDGPAIEWNDGEKYYYIEGKKYDTKEEFDKVSYMYKNGLMDYL